MLSMGGQEPGSSSNSQKEGGNCNNKFGRNQYKDRPQRDDPHVSELLKQYHLKGISDRRKISKLLLEEHGITLGESSISRRKKELGLRSSHLTTLELSAVAKRQLVLDQMAKDPAGKFGPRMVKQKIFEETGIQLTRDYVRAEMKVLDPVGSSIRGPAHVKAKRRAKQQETQLSQNNVDRQYVPDTLPNQSRTALSNPSLNEIPEPYNMPSPPSTNSYDDRLDFETHPYEDAGESHQISTVNPTDHDQPLPALPSRSMSTILNTLQDTTPHMNSLIHLIGSLETEESLNMQDYDTILKGMESAALLERQLSRLISKNRPQNV